MKPTRSGFVLFIGLWICLMFSGRSSALRDPGTFFHTALGERLLTLRRFPVTDEFTSPFAGRPWIAQQWLGETGMALLHRVGGFDALLLAAMTLLAGFYAWLAIRWLEAGLHPLFVGLGLALVLAASTHHFLIRPHLLSIVLLGWLTARLSDVDAARRPLESLWVVVPVFAFWANCHGAMLGGLATLWLCTAGWALIGPLLGRGPLTNWQAAGQLVAISAAAGLTILANPYGLELPRTWLSIMDTAAVGELIQEHVGLFHVWWGWNVAGLGLLYLLLLALAPWRCWRVSMLLPAFWLLQSVARVRHSPLFAATFAIALAEFYPLVRCRLAAWFPTNVWWQEPAAASANDAYPGFPRSSRWLSFAAIGLVTCGLILQSAGIDLPLLGRGWARLDPTHWPVAELPAIRAFSEREPPGTPIFNEMLFGGFLVYHAPRLRISIDDRCELAGEDGLRDYVATGQDAEQLRAYSQRWGFRAALTIPGSGFDQAFRNTPGWRIIHASPAATWFEQTR